MRVTVIRHHVVDSPGFIADALEARGADISVHLYPDDGPLPDPAAADHVVMLGASFSVYDGPADRPAIAPELDWLRKVDQTGVPVLGICFGAQALATVLGGKVLPVAGGREIGWYEIDSLDESMIPAGPWLEFHGDVCLPPLRARVLASNRIGVQAFSIGRHLGVQFHPEVDGAQLRRWLEDGGLEWTAQAGVDAELLVRQTIAQEAASRLRAERLVAAALRIASHDRAAAQLPANGANPAGQPAAAS